MQRLEKKSMSQIEGAQSLAYTHGIKYTGKIFVYCPWCGRRLTPIEDLGTIEFNDGLDE